MDSCEGSPKVLREPVSISLACIGARGEEQTYVFHLHIMAYTTDLDEKSLEVDCYFFFHSFGELATASKLVELHSFLIMRLYVLKSL